MDGADSGEEQRESCFFWALMIRYGLLYWVLLGIHALLLDSALLGNLSSVWNMLIHLFVLLLDLAFFIHLVISIFKKETQLIYEKLSRTSHVISWPEKRLQSDVSSNSPVES